jgi:uncharacterized protein Veg
MQQQQLRRAKEKGGSQNRMKLSLSPKKTKKKSGTFSEFHPSTFTFSGDQTQGSGTVFLLSFTGKTLIFRNSLKKWILGFLPWYQMWVLVVSPKAHFL